MFVPLLLLIWVCNVCYICLLFSRKRARAPSLNNIPIWVATPIHDIDNCQYSRPVWCELTAFVFRGFICCSNLMGKSESLGLFFPKNVLRNYTKNVSLTNAIVIFFSFLLNKCQNVKRLYQNPKYLGY